MIFVFLLFDKYILQFLILDVVLCMFVLENSIDVVPGERHNKCAWPKDQIVD